MPNRMYQRGNAFERRVKAHLEDCGFVALQTRGSKGSFDIVALPKPIGWETLLVQVKAGETSLSHTAWNRLFDDAKRIRAAPLIADRDGRHIRYRRIHDHHQSGSRHWPAENYPL